MNSRVYLNTADRNTISYMYAHFATIKNVTFDYNIAKSLSKNIFIGFSNLTIN